MDDKHLMLAHGNGGRFMRELIDEVIVAPLAEARPDVNADAVPLDLESPEILVTTDGFTVQPLEFPGGDIGALAVHGTVNDLAVAGARARYLTLNVFAEEGLEIATLERVMQSLAAAAAEAGVAVVAGDTKVVPRGQGGGLYLATTGVGVRALPQALDMGNIRAGDRVLVSGPVGNHGIAVMLAREAFGLKGDLRSDSACVLPLAEALMPVKGLRFMRDPTRGGIATVCHEIARHTDLAVSLNEPDIPVEDPVRSVCDMLGYDPYYLACEGRVVAVVDPADSDAALDAWRRLPEGRTAAVIGEITDAEARVVVRTELGGERMLEELEDDPLPRIC